MLKVYSFISSPPGPVINIFVPSGLKITSVTVDSSLLTSSAVPLETGVTSLALAPSLTDKVAFSLIVPVLSAATGGEFTVIVSVPVSVAAPSERV